MGVQQDFYSTDGQNKTFPSTKHIATKQHMAVWLRQKLDTVEVQLDPSKYELITNAAVLNSSPSTILYDRIEIRVADSFDELTSSPSAISVVAGIAEEVVTVAGIESEVVTVADDTVALNLVADDLAKGIGTNQPTDSAILNALTNATQTQADVVLAAASANEAAASAASVNNPAQTITELLSFDTSVGYVNVLGYHTANDGGGDIFNYNSTIDKSTANGGTIVDPSVSLALQGTGVGFGCWVRQTRTSTTLKEFGIVGNGSNESVQFKRAIESGLDITGDSDMIIGILFPLDSDLPVLPSGKSFYGNMCTFKILGKNYSVIKTVSDNVLIGGFNVDGNDVASFSAVRVHSNNMSNVIVRDINIRDVYNRQADAVDHFSISVRGNDSSNITIENIHSKNIKVYGDGIIGTGLGSARTIMVQPDTYTGTEGVFYNSSIDNISSETMINVNNVGVRTFEDSDTVHIQSANYNGLDCCSNISHISSINGAKRSVKLQCSGITVSNVAIVADAMPDGSESAWSAVSAYGSNITASNIVAKGYIDNALDGSGNNICISNIDIQKPSSLARITTSGGRGAVRISSPSNNIAISNIALDVLDMSALQISNTDNTGGVHNVSASNITGNCSAILLTNNNFADSVTDISISNVNIELLNDADFPPIYCIGTHRINLSNIKSKTAQLSTTFADVSGDDNIFDNVAIDNPTGSASILIKLRTSNRSVLKGITVNSCSIAVLADSSIDCSFENISCTDKLGTSGVQFTDATGVTASNINGFANSLYARGTTTTGISLTGASSSVNWYVNASIVYTKAQLQLLQFNVAIVDIATVDTTDLKNKINEILASMRLANLIK